MKPLYLCLLVALMTTGCTHTPPYIAPANAPQAQIRSEMNVGSNYRNGLDIAEVPAVGCKYGRSVVVKPGRQLFSVYKDTSRPDGFIAIEAGRPLHLQLSGYASAQRSCYFAFTGTFSANARYVIKGGIVDRPGMMGSCLVDIFDQDSGARLPLTKEPAPRTSGCALDTLPGL